MMNDPRREAAAPSELSKQERRVFSLAEQDPLRFATSTAAEIGDLTSTSEATVVRTAQKLGHSGIKEMKLACAAAVDRSQSLGGVIRSRLDHLPKAVSSAGPKVAAEGVLTSAADLLIRLNDSLSSRDISEIVEAMTSGRRLGVYGLGTGYHIAQYFCLELERIGVDAFALTGSGHSAADAIHKVSDEDTLIVLAPLLIFSDVRKLLNLAVRRAKAVVVISQDEMRGVLSESVQYIQLPSTSAGAASESVAAWALCDVLVAEIARLYPDRAIETRNYVQQLREIFATR